jgi:Flp pilus assembly protein TadD
VAALLNRGGRFAEALEEYRRAEEVMPTHPLLLNNLAWHLATCPDPAVRNPAEATRLAEEAVAAGRGKPRPEQGTYGNTLGVARYRNGEWRPAIEALTKAMDLRKGGDSFDYFFLAMAHWRLGEKEQARTWYDMAIAWMDKHKPKDEELRRFRVEAAELLTIPAGKSQEP